MARPVRVIEDIEAALECLRTTKGITRLKHAQAVVLPQVFGWTVEQTAEAVGLSKQWVSKIRNEFVAQDDDQVVRGGRRRESFSKAQEAALLKPFFETAQRGGILVVAQIKAYNILHRNGWRKLAPDKRHPQSDPKAQEAFKKTPRVARRGRKK
jgi:Winged helix-turn helix/Homeodomain-like domain